MKSINRGGKSSSLASPSMRQSDNDGSSLPVVTRDSEPASPADAGERLPIPITPPTRPDGLTRLRQRRSSFTERLGSLAHYGGHNSFNNYASSWQRAAAFRSASHPHLQAIDQRRLNSNDTEAPQPIETEDRPLFSNGLEAGQVGRSNSIAVDDTDTPEFYSSSPDIGARIAEHRRQSLLLSPNIFDDLNEESQTANYGSSYGALSSRLTEPAKRHAERLFTKQQERNAAAARPKKENEPLLQRVESKTGERMIVVVGQSTLPQTIFNSVNVLVGVGMLSLPLAIHFSGWLIGMSFFLLSAIVTSYTARLLAKCLDVDRSLVTFSDIAYISFGPSARIVVNLLFGLELLGASVALVILFADSVDLLIPDFGVTAWKIVCGLITIPLGFLPLRFLSFTSIVGIFGCILIVVAVFVDGLLKPSAIGSLRDPATTYLFPRDWRTLCLAFGLLIAPWGGHGVFPNIYRDMRHPQKYPKAVRITYVFTAALTVAGYLMFGDEIRNELTANIFLTKGYPRWLSIMILIAIAIIPLTKIPLTARPIVSTIENPLGLNTSAMAGGTALSGMSSLTRGILRIVIRIVVPVCFVILAILIPSFDRVMSLVGSLACFAICIVLPCSFHLKIFGKDIGMLQRMLDWFLIVVCTILAILGTVCSFLPKRMLGAA